MVIITALRKIHGITLKNLCAPVKSMCSTIAILIIQNSIINTVNLCTHLSTLKKIYTPNEFRHAHKHDHFQF